MPIRVGCVLAHPCPMSEYVLILYPILLFGYLMLAARWQPKSHPAQHDDSSGAARGHGRRRS